MTLPGTEYEPLTLDEIQSSNNLTEFFHYANETDEDGKNTYLTQMAHKVIRGYQIDKDSRKEWEEIINRAMKLAKLTIEVKNFPWPKAANMKYPLIANASISFASRIRPELFPNDKIVQTRIQGTDLDGSKWNRSNRVSNCMSYQLLSSPDWKDGVDSLLQMLPVVGTVFKKTYYSELEKRNISEVCAPDKCVVNYNVKSLKTAPRVTHVITLSGNDVIERQRKGLFNKFVRVDELRPQGCDPDDDNFEIEFLEQHCWWDLDNDGYKEPYIVTVHEASMNVMRIVSRIDEIEYVTNKKSKEKEVAKIIAEDYFTDFHFIKSPDGGYYSLGFGHLLLSLNLGIDTTFNQLINAGLLSTTQGGFLGKGLRIRDGEYMFKPYEWKVLDAMPGTDMAKEVYPFPVREPSSTLFNLLNLMIQIGKELTSSTEAFTGNLNGTNTSQSVLNTLVEQSAKGMYVAIHARLFDSLGEEYGKLQKLNYKFLSDKEYEQILDVEEVKVKDDFNPEDCDVMPVADPNISTINQRIQKIQILMSLRTANPAAVDEYTLRTLQFNDEEIKVILSPPPNQGPSARDQKDMAAAQLAQAQAAKAQFDMQLAAAKAPTDIEFLAKQIQTMDAQAQESAARVWKMQKDAAHGDQKVLIAGGKMQQQESLKQALAKQDQEKIILETVQKNKELDLKAAKAAADAALENKKLDIMKEQVKNDKGSDRQE